MCGNTNVTGDISELLGVSKKDFIRYCTSENLKKIQTGEMSTEEFWHEFSKNSKIEIGEEFWGKFFKPVRKPEMYDLIEILKKKYRVVLGTNTIEPHYLVHKRNGDYDIFEKIYPSHLMGIAKPDPEFLEHIIVEEGYRIKDTVFIDDTSENIESALKSGIEAYNFENRDKLVEDLKNYL